VVCGFSSNPPEGLDHRPLSLPLSLSLSLSLSLPELERVARVAVAVGCGESGGPQLAGRQDSGGAPWDHRIMPLRCGESPDPSFKISGIFSSKFSRAK